MNHPRAEIQSLGISTPKPSEASGLYYYKTADADVSRGVIHCYTSSSAELPYYSWTLSYQSRTASMTLIPRDKLAKYELDDGLFTEGVKDAEDYGDEFLELKLDTAAGFDQLFGTLNQHLEKIKEQKARETQFNRKATVAIGPAVEAAKTSSGMPGSTSKVLGDIGKYLGTSRRNTRRRKVKRSTSSSRRASSGVQR